MTAATASGTTARVGEPPLHRGPGGGTTLGMMTSGGAASGQQQIAGLRRGP
ncbi:hypothetical protein Scep_010629 [Stephania cephalantha]|uniref:Uncharacterized protein n=1 Tax=Stephania cephalantha TaxID=152367 RepID=A0AAP0PDH0_9MAGN